MKARYAANNAQERSLIALLRGYLPEEPPPGWSMPLGDIRRVTPYDEPGTFGAIYEGKNMRVLITANTFRGETSILGSIAGLGGTLSDGMVETALADLFPHRNPDVPDASTPGVAFFSFVE